MSKYAESNNGVARSDGTKYQKDIEYTVLPHSSKLADINGTAAIRCWDTSEMSIDGIISYKVYLNTNCCIYNMTTASWVRMKIV